MECQPRVLVAVAQLCFFVSTASESHHNKRVPLDILTSWGGWLVLEFGIPTFLAGVAMTNGCQCLKKTSRKRPFFCVTK